MSTLIRELQSRVGVTADGIYSPATHAAVMAALGTTAPTRTLKSPAAFFSRVRNRLGSLNQPQVEGFNALLDAMKGWPASWVAYGLATAWHETAATMQPIKEYGGPAYFKRMYDIEGERPAKARELGNTSPGDGARYAGRGYVQLTGKTNYERYGIADTPDDAMKADVAARILVDGMSRGAFTGKALKDYLPGDYVGARRIINAQDKAQDIAKLAIAFENALKEGGWG